MIKKKQIPREQKLLEMYRALLAEYLRQEKLWGEGNVPELLSTGLTLIRREIMNIKGKLRSWEVIVIDQPDDNAPDNELAHEIKHQQELLGIHRTTLMRYLEQYEQIGEHQATPIIIHSIDRAREEIGKIKAILRAWNISVEDLPGDEAL